MTRLSININKIALLRNARGSNVPDLLQFAKDCERYGAHGITVHPRPDERHITRRDLYLLKEIVKTEFNIEGYPTDDFIKMMLDIRPQQCTLVPDAPAQLTSDHGWDTVKFNGFLSNIIHQLKQVGIRVSLFIDPDMEMIAGAKKVGADRVEFYTGAYAHLFESNKHAAVKAYTDAAIYADAIGIGINAGHDLNLDNLKFFKENVSGLQEVSIGHALVRDCLYFGLENTIQLYLRKLA